MFTGYLHWCLSISYDYCFPRYELYSNRDESGNQLPMSLPASDFKLFENDGELTWSSFRKLQLYPIN